MFDNEPPKMTLTCCTPWSSAGEMVTQIRNFFCKFDCGEVKLLLILPNYDTNLHVPNQTFEIEISMSNKRKENRGITLNMQKFQHKSSGSSTLHQVNMVI